MKIDTFADKLSAIIKEKAKDKPTFIVAIDGRCASGKTTLAELLTKRLGCQVVHTDDFYLPKLERTEARLAEVGGHMDTEKLLAEVLTPLREGRAARYRPYLCCTDRYGEGKEVLPSGTIVVEGSYSHHPVLKKCYDLTVFLRISPAAQAERIRAREGERANDFFERWIPLEERYLNAFDVEDEAKIGFNAE